MNLERVIAALAPTAVVGRAPDEISDLAYDTRRVREGALFFCIRGAHVDGHDLAADALAAGASALVVERELDVAAPQIVVASVRAAMPQAAVVFFADPTAELEVVGVTGTSGKTTTSYLIRSILEAAGRRPGLIGSIERLVGGQVRPSELNTPEAIDLQRLFREMVAAGDRSCVLEATSHASVQGRLEGTRFAALVFTNLSQDHLDFHVTFERYFEAKRRLFRPGIPAAVNVGDPYGRRLAAALPDALTYGLTAAAAVGPDTLDGIELRLLGRFNTENALAAIAAGRLLGIDDAAIRRGIEGVAGVPGRFEAVDEGQAFRVVVDYAHKPDAPENVLRAARPLGPGRP